MHKQFLERFIALVKPYHKITANIVSFIGKKISLFFQKYFTSWWQIILTLVFAIVFLYYPLGGWVIHNIDTSTYKAQTNDGRLGTIDTISHLINREVHHKLWTPNLPFIFPSYFLDNMPSFQLGLMSAITTTAKAFDVIPLISASDAARANLKEGIELLQYPGEIWLFSSQNSLLPAPSSNTQYKKGRKKLNNFNREIAGNKVSIDKNAQNLSLFLYIIKKDINKNINNLEKHIRENNRSFFDFKADNEFYFTQGKLYSYSQILKSLGNDFKNVLIKHDIYTPWTSMLKSLEQASKLNPSIIRNADTNSSFAPNHLITINYYATRALNRLNSIINKLDISTDTQL
ncbi:MAG: DUF2333 family protein [Alphaproteobacteria bacterium]|nr:DUF2333 family protein [Alphaproteobacteria bacterium]